MVRSRALFKKILLMTAVLCCVPLLIWISTEDLESQHPAIASQNETVTFDFNGMETNIEEFDADDDERIDVVYTWVNGSDLKFQEELQFYSKSVKRTGEFAIQRFRDKNELRFSLRSIEKYAPWVNHIYIVTNGQIPSWLNLTNEKVTVIFHADIFGNKDNLPTFSSPAIESNLHKIPGLSKHYLYFNDDVFLGQPLEPKDFYTKENGYKVFLAWEIPRCGPRCSWAIVADGKCNKGCNNAACMYDGGDCSEDHSYPPYDSKSIDTTNIDCYGASLLHTHRLLNIRYGFKKRKVAAHAPMMINRDIMRRLFEVFQREFAETESHRFREPNDLQFGLIYYYYLMSEKRDDPIETIFEMFDGDSSGSWTDIETNQLLVKIDDNPPRAKTIETFAALLKNCVSSTIQNDSRNLPALTLDNIVNCPDLRAFIEEAVHSKNKYKFEVVKSAEKSHVTLELLISDVEKMKITFKRLTNKKTKFICLNDDLEDRKDQQNKVVVELMQNFYLSNFPNASSFELPQKLELTEASYMTADTDDHRGFVIVLLSFIIVTTLIMPVICLFVLTRLNK